MKTRTSTTPLSRQTSFSRRGTLALTAALAFPTALSAHAQSALPSALQQSTSAPLLMAAAQPAEFTLPDSPGALLDAPPTPPSGESSSLLTLDLASPADAQSGKALGLPMAAKSDLYIAPGQPVPTLTFKDKFNAGLKDTVSPFAAIGWLISAGISQGLDDSPNYGQDGKAFAQRLGAAAARSSSQRIFSESILAGVLHEDDRYYRLGAGHNFVHRLVYAGTRTLITRTDSGRATPNFSLLGGNLGAAYLTTAYYPAQNTTTSEVFSSFGTSIAGSAVGFVVSEFLSGALNIFHSSKPTAN